jgi:cleavage stimulation factor subunit 2
MKFVAVHTGIPQPPPQQQQSQQQKHDIFVGNLNFNTTEEQLHQAFSELGRIIRVRMVTDLETGKPRGFAFIEFEDPQAALSAIRNMNDTELNGRKLRVNFSNSSHLETLAGKLGMNMTQSTTVHKVPAIGVVEAPAVDQGTQAVANALKSMSKGEMYDIIKKLKEIADSDADEARKLISGHPQLPEAILHLMSRLEMMRTPLPNALGIPGIPPPPAPMDTGRLDPRQQVSDPRKAVVPPPNLSVPPPSQVPQLSDPRARADPRAAARADPRAAARPVAPPPVPQTHLPPPPPMQGYMGAPPPMAPAPTAMSVAGLDPSLVQQVMGLTPQQIQQLPIDKQQSIIALRQQITNSMV